ncbi:MAG: hypothetical protein LBC94_01825 [Desulfovibrio sp.]|jgi:hypothetical protein|nr:hypothetical protein [Desulfovibrio sp.]
MRVVLLCAFLLFAAVCRPALAAPLNAAGSEDASGDDQGWSVMPAGARPAYMGIHGGTMPVSLLVVADGSSLLGFVGRTGNDFLDALRGWRLPLLLGLASSGSVASEKSAEKSGEEASIPASFAGVSGLFVTGSGLTSLPVIQTNSSLAAIPLVSGRLLPFGFSESPLPIEGEIVPPAKSVPQSQYRLVVDPRYLRPRDSR